MAAASLNSALRPSAKTQIDADSRPRMLVSDERDDFEANANVDWYAGEECLEENVLLVKMDWWRWVPCLNMLADVLNDLPIIPDRLEQLLSMLATVYSLMLAIAISIPLAFNFGELTSAIARFAPNGTYYDPTITNVVPNDEENFGTYLVNTMMAEVSISIGLLTSSLMADVVIYLTLSCTSFRDPWRERNTNMLRDWWFWLRGSVFFMLLFSIVGMIYMFRAVSLVYIVKVPSHRCQKAAVAGDLMSCLYNSNLDTSTPWRYYDLISVCFAFPVFVVMGILLPSAGLTQKTYSYCKMQQERIRAMGGHLTMDDEEAEAGNTEVVEQAPAGNPAQVHPDPDATSVSETGTGSGGYSMHRHQACHGIEEGVWGGISGPHDLFRRVVALEATMYPTEKAGGLVDRVAALERDVIGYDLSGPLGARVAALEESIGEC